MNLISMETLITDRLLNAQKVFPVPAKSNFPLKCVFSRTQLRIPSTGLHCSHHGRIELKELLGHLVRVQSWNCPHCGAPTPLKDIYVDLVLREAILHSDSSTESVNIYPDHSWELVFKPTEQDIFRVLVTKLRKNWRSSSIQEKSVGVMETRIDQNKQSHSDYRLSALSLHTRTANPQETPHQDSPYFEVKDIFWFPNEEPDCYFYVFERHLWRNIPYIPNVNTFLLEYTITYTPQGAYVLGGLDYNCCPVDSAFSLSRQAGLQRIPSMKHPRYRFATVFCQDKVFVIGGCFAATVTSSVEAYELTREKWESRRPLSVARAGATACAVNTETFLVMGGTNDLFTYVKQIEEYHASTDDWMVLNVSLPVGLIGAVSYSVPQSNSVFIFGGYSEDSGESGNVICLYRPKLKWILDLPALKMPCTDHWRFPVIFDGFTRLVHLFNGSEEPIHHLYYSLAFLQEALAQEMSGDLSTVNESLKL